MELSEKTCTPCQGGMPALDPAQAASLATHAPDWQLTEGSKRLVRGFKFKTYRDALAFVDAISAVAESEGHHPDISFGWGYATVTLYTHKIGGLHENDFIMAAKFDRAYAGQAG